MAADFYVTAIGASSGGLEELNSFFDYTTALGISYVIVHHFSMENTISLVELIARHSKLKIAVAEDGMKLIQNMVYLLPIDRIVTINKYCFNFNTHINADSLDLKIDLFFKSLASCCGNKAVAILLSGTGSAETGNLKRIKKAGGTIIARNPKTTVFDKTPENAIESGLVDHILEPELMPAVIAAIVNGNQKHNITLT